MTVKQGRDVAPVCVEQASAHLSAGETLLGVFALSPGNSAATVLAVTDRRVLGLRDDELVLASCRPPVAPAGTGVGRVAFPDRDVTVRLLHPIELIALKSLPNGAETTPARPPRRQGVHPVPPHGPSARRPEPVGATRSPHRRRDPTRMRLGLATWLYTAVGVGLYVWLSAQLGFWPLVVLAVAAVILLVAWLLGRDAAVAATEAVQVGPDEYPALHRHVRPSWPVSVHPPCTSHPCRCTTPSLPICRVGVLWRSPSRSWPLLPTGKLRAVLDHEEGHLRNRDTVVTQVFAAITLATTMLLALLGFVLAVVFAMAVRRERDVDAVGMVIGFMFLVGAFLAAAFQALGCRHRELMADEAAAELADGHDLIRALTTIDAATTSDGAQLTLGLAAAAPRLFISPFAGRVLGSVLASHPSTRRRIRRLQRLLEP